jgi:predicted O-methyltransferase YrrM
MTAQPPISVQRYFPLIHRLPGFLTADMLQLFSFMAQMIPSGNPVLEIGVFCGSSLAGLACAFPDAGIVGVDPFFQDFGSSPAFPEEAEFLTLASNFMSPEKRKENLWAVLRALDEQHAGLSSVKRVRLVESTQTEYLQGFLGRERFQLIHIDGEHTYQAIKDCLDALVLVLDPCSWIVVDDLLNAGFPDISEAVHQHPSYRTEFWPAFYGFNKGVFLYRPRSADYLASIKFQFKTLYAGSDYVLREMHDGAVYVARRMSSPIPNKARWSRLRAASRFCMKLLHSA